MNKPTIFEVTQAAYDKAIESSSRYQNPPGWYVLGDDGLEGPMSLEDAQGIINENGVAMSERIVIFQGKHGDTVYLYTEEKWPRICMSEIRARIDNRYLPTDRADLVGAEPQKPNPLPELKPGAEYPDWALEEHESRMGKFNRTHKLWAKEEDHWNFIEAAIGGDLRAAVWVITYRSDYQYENYTFEDLGSIPEDVPYFRHKPHHQVALISAAFHRYWGSPTKENVALLRTTIEQSCMQGEPCVDDIPEPKGFGNRKWAADAERLSANLLRHLNAPEDKKLRDRIPFWLGKWGWPGKQV